MSQPSSSPKPYPIPTRCATSLQQTSGVVQSSFTSDFDHIVCLLAIWEKFRLSTATMMAMKDGPEPLHLKATARCASRGLLDAMPLEIWCPKCPKVPRQENSVVQAAKKTCEKPCGGYLELA